MGDRPAVVLDTTAFYPTSGGQPFDTGTLGDARVIEVVESESGEVLHLVDREHRRQARRCAGGSTGRGASTTCSSTPGSTSCRRRSTS